ncbi:MAG: autotransporter-associated beta strand repeat-containing protein, partial [Verrucomicrobiota bacterium]
MKTSAALRLFLAGALAAHSATHVVQAASIYWDGRGTDWNAAGNWSTAAGAIIPNPLAAPGAADVVTFSISPVNSAQAVDLNGNQSALGLIFLAASPETILLGGMANGILTLGGGGITVNNTTGAVTFGSITDGQKVNLVLAAPQTWANQAAYALTLINGVNNGGNLLTLTGTGSIALDGAVTGTGGLTKSGAGTLTLAGENSYGGLTTLSGGTLLLGAAGSATNSPLGTTAAGTTVLSGAALDLNGYSLGTAEALTLNGTGGFGGGALCNNSATAATYSGLLTLGSASSIVASSGEIILSNTGTIQGAGFGLTLDGTASSSLASSIGTGAGTLTKSGIGIWSLSGASTYTGLTKISGGTLRLGVTNAILSGNAVTIDSTAAAETATLDLNGFALTIGGGGLTLGGTSGIGSANQVIGSGAGSILTLSGGGSAVTYSAANNPLGATISVTAINLNNVAQTFTINDSSLAADDLTISAVIQNGALTKSGVGTLLLTGANTYSGATTLNAGTLSIAADANLGSANPLVFNGGTLQITGTALTGYASGQIGTHPVTLTSGPTVGLDISDGTNTFTVSQGLNQGSGGLTKLGAGTLVLGGANTYTGLTTVNAGALRLGVGNAIPVGNAVTVNSTTVGETATLDLGGFAFTIGSGLTLGGTGATDSSTNQVTGSNAGSVLTLASTLTYTATNNPLGAIVSVTTLDLGGTLRSFSINDSINAALDLTISSAIQNGGLTKDGTGTLLVSGTNTYGGLTTVGAGTLMLGAAGSGANTPLGTTAAGTSVTSGATLDLNGFSLTTSEALTLNGSGVNNASGALTNSSATAATYAGLLTLGSTSSIVAGNGDIILSNPGMLIGSGAGFSLKLMGSATDCSLASSLNTGTGSLYKLDPGTWTLTGASTFTGLTAIYGGTLRLGVGNAIKSGNAVTVGSNIAGETATLDLGGFGQAIGGAGLTLGGSAASVNQVIGSGAGSILTLSGGVTALTYLATSNPLGSDITATTLDLSGAALTFTIGDSANAVNDLTISSVIRNGTMIKAGAGTLALSGANTYTGTTTLNAGILNAGCAQNGAVSGPLGVPATLAGSLLFNGGTLQYSVANTYDYSARFATSGNNAYRIDTNGQTVALGNALPASGTSGLTKSGTGTLTLNVVNTYAGPTTVNGGNLLLDVNNAIPAGSSVTVNATIAGDPTVLDLGGFAQTIGGAGLILGGTGAAVSTNQVTGTGTGSVLTLTGGPTALTYSNTNNPLEATISATTLDLNNAAQTFAVGDSSNAAYDLTISSTLRNGALIKTGAGTLVLSGANLYTGTTTLNAGILNAGDAELAGVSGPLGNPATPAGSIVFNGGTLQYSAANTYDYSARFTTSGNNPYRIDTNGETVLYANALPASGTSGLTKLGVGILNLSVANTYVGLTTVNAGTLRLGVANAIPVGAAVAINATTGGATATLDLNGFAQTIGGAGLTFGGGADAAVGTNQVIGSGAGSVLTLSGGPTALTYSNTNNPLAAVIAATTLDLNGATQTLTIGDSSAARDLTITSVIRNGSLTKAGAGTLLLTGENTFNGLTIINNGTLMLGAAGNAINSPLGTSAAGTNVLSNGSLDLNGVTLSTSEPLTLNGTGASGGGALTNGTAMAATYGGPLTLGSASTIAARSGDIILSNPGTLVGSGFGLTLDGSSNASSIASSIGTGAGTLTKTGSGTWTLTGTNTFSGLLSISNGTLAVATLNNAGSDGPLGNSAGAVSLGGGGTGTLRYTGGTVTSSKPFTLAGGGTGVFQVDIAATALTLGGVLSGSGTLSKTGPGMIVLAGSNTHTGSIFLNAGILQLSGALGAMSTTTGITFNGGYLTLLNTGSSEGSLNRMSNSAAITSNGGILTYTNTAGAGNIYAETLGALSLNAGRLDVILSNDQNGGSGNAQTLTFSGLSRPGGSASVAFSAAGGLTTTTNMLKLTGVTPTPAGQIIGLWATVGTSPTTQSDYAVCNAAGYLVAANIPGTSQTTWTNAANTYTLRGADALTATRTINALRFTGASSTLALGIFNLETFSIFNGGFGTLTITGPGAIRQQGTAAANLLLNPGNSTIAISARLVNNSGALTLVKAGAGTLTLSGNNTATGALSVDGGGTLNLAGSNTFAGGIDIGASSAANIVNVSGRMTGLGVAGNLNVGSTTFGGNQLNLSGEGSSANPTLGIGSSNVAMWVGGRDSAASNNSLTISNGAYVSISGGSGTTDSSVGKNAGSSNNLLKVSGTRSTFVTGGHWLIIGDAGSSNTMIVDQGGRAQVRVMGVGFTGSNNTATVDGGNSSLVVTEDLIIGGGANGSGNSVIVSNGGYLNTQTRSGKTEFSCIIAKYAGANNNAVTISGANSRWIDNGYPVMIGGNADSVSCPAFSWVDARGNSLSISSGGTAVINTGVILSGTNSSCNLGNGTNISAMTVGSTRDGGVKLSVADARLNFNSGRLTAGVAGTLVSGPGQVLLNGPGYIATSQVNSVITSVIAGSGNLIKEGVGTLTLVAANTHTGATLVNAGTLALGYDILAANKLANTSALVLGGGTLDLVGGMQTEVVAATTLNAGRSGVTAAPATSVLRMNAITPGVGIVNFGAAGIASTSNANDSSGILGAWATLGGSDWAMRSGTLEGNGNYFINAYTGYINLNARGPSTIANALTTNVRINGNGTSGNISLGAATTTINTLLQNNASFPATVALVPGNVLATNGIMIGSGMEALSIGAVAGNGSLRTATAGANLVLNNNNAAVDLTINVPIVANGASGLAAAGVIILNGVNTYTGNTGIGADAVTALGVTTYSGGLTIGGAGQLGGGNYAGAISISGGVGLIFASSANQILGGVLSGDGSFTQSGTGTLVLAGANTYSGVTTSNAGVLTAGSATAFGPVATAALVFGEGSTGKVRLNGNDITLNSLNTGGTVGTPIIESGSGTAGTDTLTVNVWPTSTGVANNSSYAGLLQDGGIRKLALVKNGTGTLTLGDASTGISTFSGGTTVNAGTLTLGNQNGLGTGSLNLAGGSTLQQTMFEGNTAAGAIPNAIHLGTGEVTLNIAYSGFADIWLNQEVSGGGTLRLVSDGNGRTLTLSGPKTFTGGIIQAGYGAYPSVAIDNVASLGSGTFHAKINGSNTTVGVLKPIADLSGGRGVANAIEIAPGARLVVEAAATESIQLSGTVSGGGALVKTGTANLILSGANTYAGPTTISSGMLTVTNAAALAGTSGVTVADGADLSYAASADAPLVLNCNLDVMGSTASILGGSIGSTPTSASIVVTGLANAMPGSGIGVNVFVVPGVTPVSGSYT